MSMLAVVVGGDGKLGSELVHALVERGHEVIATTRRGMPNSSWQAGSTIRRVHLDLLEPSRGPNASYFMNAVPFVPVVVMYLVAAVTGVIQCEADPTTWRVNADAPALLAAEARRRGWGVVFVSSDAVECAPHTAYAMQKAHAESVVLAVGGQVFRPARILPDKYKTVADRLVAVGERPLGLDPQGAVGRSGITRWEG